MKIVLLLLFAVMLSACTPTATTPPIVVVPVPVSPVTPVAPTPVTPTPITPTPVTPVTPTQPPYHIVTPTLEYLPLRSERQTTHVVFTLSHVDYQVGLLRSADSPPQVFIEVKVGGRRIPYTLTGTAVQLIDVPPTGFIEVREKPSATAITFAGAVGVFRRLE